MKCFIVPFDNILNVSTIEVLSNINRQRNF